MRRVDNHRRRSRRANETDATSSPHRPARADRATGAARPRQCAPRREIASRRLVDREAMKGFSDSALRRPMARPSCRDRSGRTRPRIPRSSQALAMRSARLGVTSIKPPSMAEIADRRPASSSTTHAGVSSTRRRRASAALILRRGDGFHVALRRARRMGLLV